MYKIENIKYLIQPINKTFPPMRPDLMDNFQAVAAFNIKFLIEEFVVQ